MDIKQCLNAKALVTLGKDMTWRDYAQGCFRMRGLGIGQTCCLMIIPEVGKLISARGVEEVENTPKTGDLMSLDSVTSYNASGGEVDGESSGSGNGGKGKDFIVFLLCTFGGSLLWSLGEGRRAPVIGYGISPTHY